MKILVCEPEKPPYVKEISEDVSDMQAVVGGYIEAVYFEEKAILSFSAMTNSCSTAGGEPPLVRCCLMCLRHKRQPAICKSIL